MICTNCGTSCPENSHYCNICGAQLTIPASSLQETPIPAPAEASILPECQDLPSPTSQGPEESPSETVSTPEEPMLGAESEAEPQILEAQPRLQNSHYPAVPQVPSYSPISGISQPATRHGSHWVPIVIMAVLCIVGLALFIALPFDADNQPVSSNSETPWFHNDNGTLYFNEELYSGPEELTIPELVDGQPVTALSSYCFAGCDLTTVILPDSMEAIDSHAFDGCTDMRGIFLPEGLTYIGDKAFFGCSELEAICIPSTVETIESGAFNGCFDLNYILYSDIHSNWLKLYPDAIGKKTQVYCTDGTYVQGNILP